MRLAQSVVRSFDRDIGAVIARLERHARVADQTAVAMELLRASEFRKEARRRQHEELKLQCERWLKPSDVKHVHSNQVRARLEGTCDWITLHENFARWTKPECSTSQNRFLVISGIHGCGKSVLASSIVARLEKSQQHTLFFAFSSSDGSRQTAENLVRTFLWLLLQETANQESVDTVHHLSLAGQPTTSELWEAFGRIASLLAKPLYCVVDGIDECIDYDHTMSMTIMQTLEKCSTLRILLLGRPHAFHAPSENSAFAAIKITSAMLQQDIEAFINDEIGKSDFLSLPEFRKDVFETLRAKSDGMFLWVRLMVDDLRKSSSRTEFSERLQNLPCGLEKAYQLLLLRLSQKLDKYELRLAQNILAFTSTSCRPLRFDEFQYVHATYCRSLEDSVQPLENYLLLQPPQRVLDVTEGLISMTDGVLRLIHSSIRDFLIRPEAQWVCEPDKAVVSFRIDIPQMNRSLAWLCLDYMRLDIDESRFLKPDTSKSTQARRDSYPLLDYATLYTFSHVNRSWPPCIITLAKIKAVLESSHSVLWAEHFGRLLFEDITLDSQMDEVMACHGRLVDADLDKTFFGIFGKTLKRRNDQTRKAGKDVDPIRQNLELYFKQVTDEQSGSFSQNRSNEAVYPISESGTARPDLQIWSANSRSTPDDPSATVSRITDLLKGQTSLHIAHQIELWLRLSTALRKTSVMIDPLKVLFRLILRKASGVHVFALLAIGDFYKKLGKFQEALEVYSASSRKMNHLDVPLKFMIHYQMGECYKELCLDVEALKSYETALIGQEIHLGRRHSDTLDTLYNMLTLNDWMDRYAEVVKLSDKICMEHEFVPELGLSRNLDLHGRRRFAHRRMGNHERAAQVEKTLQATLKKCHESHRNDDAMPSGLCKHVGEAYSQLGEDDKALEIFQLTLEKYQKSKGSNLRDTLYVQYKIADVWTDLGRYHEAKGLLEAVHAKQQNLLGPNHREVQWTKNSLDTLSFDDSVLAEEDRYGLDEEDEYKSDEEGNWNELDEEEDGYGLDEAGLNDNYYRIRIIQRRHTM